MVKTENHWVPTIFSTNATKWTFLTQTLAVKTDEHPADFSLLEEKVFGPQPAAD